jgi:signal transduction histidine kinase
MNSQPTLVRMFSRLFRIRTEHDLRRARRAARLASTFAVLIILPVVLLAYFALTTTQDGSVTLEAELLPKATTLTREVLAEEREIFLNFEAAVNRRIHRSQSAVSTLDELSPFLIAAFELDEAGALREPFDLPSPTEPTEVTQRFERLWRQAIRAEQRDDLVAAHALYGRATDATDNDRLWGEARLAQARVGTKIDSPSVTYAHIVDQYSDIRDPRGFRLGDIAGLMLAEAQVERGDGVRALRELVESLMAQRWVLFEGGEPTVARHALARMDTLRNRGVDIDTEWLSRTRLRLEQRDAQLFWSGYLYDAHDGLLEVVLPPVQPRDGMIYRHVDNSLALWAVRSLDNQRTLAFAFNREATLIELARVATRLADLDPDLSVAIVPTDAETPSSAVLRNSLAFLPFHEIRVYATDPAALQAARRRRTATRVAIIVLAIVTSLIGMAVTLRYVTKELETARVKTDFAANVSHELRSPLTQIRLKAEALQLDLTVDEQDRRAHYDAIVREAERLSRLIDNVLDFASIERGAKKYLFRPEDPVALLTTTVDSNLASLRAAGMEVEVSIPDDLPVIWIDREAMSQVFTNLISNAIKYGSTGRWFGLKAKNTSAGIEIQIEDKGIGIGPEDRARIFEDFYRSADPAVRRMKGTGIGLTIVRYIVEAHGGQISVESTPGQGTKFVITLPHKPPTGSGA